MPGLLGERHARGDADAGHDQVAVDRVAVPGADALDAAGALQRSDVLAEPERDAVLDVQVAVDGADLVAEDLRQRQLVGRDHRDVDAGLAGGGGDLDPIQPAPIATRRPLCSKAACSASASALERR